MSKVPDFKPLANFYAVFDGMNLPDEVRTHTQEAVSSSNFTLTQDNVLERRQALHAHRTSGVEFVR